MNLSKTSCFYIFAFWLIAGAFSWADTSTSAPRPPDDSHFGETKEQRDARMAWWREAKFGMFIHWGLYSVPAGFYHGVAEKPHHGEWIMHDCKIPVAEYADYANQFNPTQFNADAWVKLAQDAGMKYMVITAKHHEGFAMFPSKVGGFNIMDNTPFKRDPLKELADASRKEGMKLGFYYSHNQDWHQPGGSAGGGHWDKAQDGSLDDYLKNIAVPQVKELLTNYGPGIPAILWWDTPMKEITPERAALFQPLLKSRPDLITNNRLSSAAPPGQGYPGDTETPEQHIPPQGYPGCDWETCMTINDTWGYKSDDTEWKSTDTLLHNLIDIASKGGNYLLNVGPDATGTIPQPEVDRLLAIGQWLKTNGDAIYGTTSSPFKDSFDWGRVTQKGHRLFVHVFTWPDNHQVILPLHNVPSKAFLLAASDQTVATTLTDDGLILQLPPTAPDPIASVIEVDIPDQLNLLPPASLTQKADGSLTLAPDDAELRREDRNPVTAKVQSTDDVSNIGYWTDPTDFVQWTVWIKTPGKFKVSVDYAAAPNANGIGLTLSSGDASLDAKLPATGDWKIYRTEPAGVFSLTKAGSVMLTLKRADKTGLCNLRSVTLTMQK